MRSNLFALPSALLIAGVGCVDLDKPTACSDDLTKCDGYDSGDSSAGDGTADVHDSFYDAPAESDTPAIDTADAPDTADTRADANTCGDGKRDGTEQCDGADLGGATCVTAVGPGWSGVLSCTPTCKLDTSACAVPTTTYNGLTDASKWAAFDLTPLGSTVGSFAGGAFDGRYVYLVPNSNGMIVRFDTTGSFAATTAWRAFDLTTVNPRAKGFFGGAFDGRYLYLTPSRDGLAARFDTTTAGLDASGAWSTFDLLPLDGGAYGFEGAAFDGYYLYLFPAYYGITVRTDTTATFGDPAARKTLDISTVAARSFAGCVFDGQYVYLSPYGLTTPHGIFARYDTTAPFGTSAWTTFDVSTMVSGAKGFRGAAFDGKYVYLVPFNNGSYDGIVQRYNTTSTFGPTGDWLTFDVSTVNAGARGFVGATFDGRYIYFVPNQDGAGSIIARYDTTAGTFPIASSWSTFDVSTVNPAAKGFIGAVFDGRYVYLVPGNGSGSPVVRFDAKSVSWETRGWNRSFF
jgi:hypothetical protein